MEGGRNNGRKKEGRRAVEQWSKEGRKDAGR